MTSPYLVAVGINGGQCEWTPPKVRAARDPNGRPEVAAGRGPDPVTGAVFMPIVKGAGAAMTNLDQARIRYIHQSWDASMIVHDSWQNGGASEPVPTDVVGGRISLVVQRAHIGDLYELVIPSNSKAAVNGQSAVIVVQIEGD